MSPDWTKHHESGVCIKLQNSSTMTIKSLYFLVQESEGFSVNADLLTYAGNDGYAVGGAADSVEMEDNNDLSFNKFREIMKLKVEFMKRQPDTGMQVIGAWVNDDNYAFIEISDVVKSKQVALELAKARGEEAIWDFKNNCEIKLT